MGRPDPRLPLRCTPIKGMARARSWNHAAVQCWGGRMGRRFALLKKAVDPLAQGGVHGRHWSRMGPHEAWRSECECAGRGGGAGLYVLAGAKAQVRLVSRAGVRSRLRQCARPVAGIDWRAADRIPSKGVGAASSFQVRRTGTTLSTAPVTTSSKTTVLAPPIGHRPDSSLNFHFLPMPNLCHT